MSTILVNTLTGTSTAGSIAVTGEGNSTTTNLQQGLAKGWVNFNGTATFNGSDDEIRDSFNITSTIDQGSGDYDFGYTTNMSNENYAVAGIANGSGASNAMINLDGAITSSAVVLRTINTADNRQDSDHCLVSVHGDLA
jgi:hypothetical protein